MRHELEAWMKTLRNVAAAFVVIAVAIWMIVQTILGHPPGMELLQRVLHHI